MAIEPNFGSDTVRYRIQIIANTFFDHAANQTTLDRLLKALDAQVPKACASEFSAEIFELPVGQAIRVRCSVRGTPMVYEIVPEHQDEMPLLPPLSIEELEENRRLHPPLPPAKVVLITARTPSGVIGMKGNLPWMIREDLQHFKASTMGKALIVGRRTYQSMPPVVWKTRIAHVLSRDSRGLAEPTQYHFASCLKGLVNSARHNYAEPGEVYIGGGAEVYALALEYGLVDEMLISEIHQHYIGDVYFPPVPEGMFDEGTIEAEYAEFNVVRYRRLEASRA